MYLQWQTLQPLQGGHAAPCNFLQWLQVICIHKRMRQDTEITGDVNTLLQPFPCFIGLAWKNVGIPASNYTYIFSVDPPQTCPREVHGQLWPRLKLHTLCRYFNQENDSSIKACSDMARQTTSKNCHVFVLLTCEWMATGCSRVLKYHWKNAMVLSYLNELYSSKPTHLNWASHGT